MRDGVNIRIEASCQDDAVEAAKALFNEDISGARWYPNRGRTTAGRMYIRMTHAQLEHIKAVRAERAAVAEAIAVPVDALDDLTLWG